jgi:GTPase
LFFLFPHALHMQVETLQIMFIDSAKVIIKSGNGGNGCLSFRREKYIPKGGPDGGDGGKGGNVIFTGDAAINNLVKFRYSPRLFARNGKHGSGSNKTGKGGADMIVHVPCGTIVYNANGGIVCEITEADIPVTVALGGSGGRGNQRFATSKNRAPRHFEEGRPGVEFNAILELKVMADVGLVGLPNAGKSSIISALSKAAPKIADYPFTTLNPVVGVIELPDYRTIVMADIPGIIEGASHGKGLGIRFLKHIERTKVLLFVVDISSFADTPPEKALNVLRGEIESFGHGLKEKKYIIAANKIDLDCGNLSEFKKHLEPELSEKVFPVSAATREGMDLLITMLDRAVNEQDMEDVS